MLDFSRKITTRDGREVRVYARDGAGQLPIHGAIKTSAGWHTAQWTASGIMYLQAESDLINPPEVVWVNVYQDRPGSQIYFGAGRYTSKELAVAVLNLSTSPCLGQFSYTKP